MAFDPTPLLEARARIDNATKMQSNELRMPYFGAAASFLAGANSLIPNISALKQSSAQVVKIPVFNKIAAGSGTVRKCAGTGTGTTALVTPAWQGITEEFAISELEHANNLVGKEAALAYLLQQKAKNIYARINTICLAYLEANKSAVNTGTYFGALVSGAKQVSQAQKDEFYSGLLAEMMSNNFTGNVEVIGGFNLQILYDYLSNQGGSNNKNLSYTVENIIPRFTAVANGTGIQSTAYAYEPGTVGLFPWINSLHRRGANIGNETWTTITLPAMPGMEQGLEVELKTKEACADNSSTITGAEADLVTSYVLHIDIAPLKAYASDTDSGVYKYEITTA